MNHWSAIISGVSLVGENTRRFDQTVQFAPRLAGLSRKAMTATKVIAALSLLLSNQLLARVIPFSDFYLSVDTNDFLHRPEKKTALCVTLSLSTHERGTNVPVGISVDCHDFEAGIRGFDEHDRELFLQTAAAAKTNQDFSADVISQAINPRQIPTHFESRKIEARYFVTVRRGEQTAKFEPEEGERLANALRDAKAGEAWYRALLTEDLLPQVSNEMHPPHARGYYVVSRIGEIDLNGFLFEVSLDCDSFSGSTDYRTGYTVKFGKNGKVNGTIGGNWKALLMQIAEGLQSLKQGRDYDFVPDDRKYRVRANRETGQVDVTVARSDFFEDRTPINGHVSGDQLDAINDLIRAVPAREKWFKDHESWFFTPSN